jgi:hypothetical protein
MKTILQILAILFVGALVSGIIYLTVENTNIFSGGGGASGFDQPPAMIGETNQLLARSDGEFDHHSASLERGFSEVLVTLAKLSGITILVLFVQSLFDRMRKRRVIKPMAG